ncbi:MAG: MFS transporter [bacterium]|nr:MFS transporter [bacterium]
MTEPSPGLLANGRGKVLLFCWLGWVFDFYDLILFAFTKRAVADDLGLDLVSEVAWIEGWSLFATAIGALGAGRIADRIGRRQGMVVSIVLFSVGALLTGLAGGYWSLFLARFVTGLGVGGEWGIGHAVVAEHWSGRQRDRVHGLLQAGSPIAMALAASVACFLAPLPGIGWRNVFLASAGLAVLALFGRVAMPGPDRAVERAAPQPFVALFAPAHLRASLVLLLVITLHMTGFWCVYAELPRYLMGMHGVTKSDVGFYQIQVNSVHVFADVAFGFLAARLGRIRVFVAFCLVFAFGHWLVLGALDSITADFSTFALVVTAMGLGAGTWSCFGALFGSHYPVALRATAAAFFYALARAAQLPIKPQISGWIAASDSFAPALWVGIACALLSAVLVLLLPRSRDATTLPPPSEARP